MRSKFALLGILLASFITTLTAQVIISPIAGISGGGGTISGNLEVDSLTTGVASPEANSLWQIKGAGTATALPTGWDARILVTQTDCNNAAFGTLATNFSTDVYDGLTIYQCAGGSVFFDVGYGAAGLGTTFTLNPNVGSDLTVGTISGADTIGLNALWTTTANVTNAYGLNVSTTSAFDHTDYTGGRFNTILTGDATNVRGNYLITSVSNAAIVTKIYGVEASTRALGTTTSPSLTSYYAAPTLGDTANIPSVKGFYAAPAYSGTPTNTAYYSFYSDNVVGIGSNPYFLWYSGGGSDCGGSGVYRVNHIGIEAYYNPCFAVYSPAAANFERITSRWGDTGVFGADNVAYFGVEVGGTGTNRTLQLIGGGLQFESTLVTPASSGTRFLCISTAGVVTSSASACSGT